MESTNYNLVSSSSHKKDTKEMFDYMHKMAKNSLFKR